MITTDLRNKNYFHKHHPPDPFLTLGRLWHLFSVGPQKHTNNKQKSAQVTYKVLLHMEQIRGDSLKALVATSSRHHFYFKSQCEHT